MNRVVHFEIHADDLDRADAGGQQVLERMAIPGVGYVAYFTDTEGNVFGVYQSDESVT